MNRKHLLLMVTALLISFTTFLYGQQTTDKEIRDKLLEVYKQIKNPEISFQKFFDINKHILNNKTTNGANKGQSLSSQDPYCNKVRPYCNNGTFETGLDQNQYVGAYGYWYSGLYPDPFGLTYGFSSGDLYDGNAHQTIVDTLTGTDPITGIRLTPPNGQKQALRLGNAVDGFGTELIAKTITVDPNESILNFYYAVVLQNPAQHSYDQQPAFSVRAYDCSTGQEIPNACNLGNNSNIAVSDVTNPFFQSKVYNGENLAYKDWSLAQINLSQYVGENVIIVFNVKDCNLGAHFGYAYLDNLFSSKCPEPPFPGNPPTILYQGNVQKNVSNTDTCGTGKICAKYGLPYKVLSTGDTTFGDVTISVDFYQNNNLVNTVTSPTITTYLLDSSYCFSINPSILGFNNSLTAFDYTITGKFNLNGFSLSPIIVGNPGTGVKSGTNNDYLINCPPIVIFYSKPTGDLSALTTWGSNPDGSGVNPPNFGAGKTFNLANRNGTYTMVSNWTVSGTINIPSGSKLQLNGNTLSEAGLTGTGTISGSSTSNLVITGSAGGDAGTHYFAGTTLNNLTLNRTGSSPSATIGSSVNLMGVLTITNGALKTNNYLTLKSSVTNTARVAPVPAAGSITGNVSVERFIPARKAWRLISAPVAGNQTINNAWQEGVTSGNPNPGFGAQITGGSAANGFDQNPLASTSIKKYNSSNDTWVPVPNTNATAVNSNAFMLFITGDRTLNPSNTTSPAKAATLRVKGPLKVGDQTFPIVSSGYVAVQNPFASPINFATITRNNVQNSFYVWDPKLGGPNGVGGYVNVSFNGSAYDVTPAPVSPESQYIQSGQAFMVHTTGATAGSLVIKESDKSATTATNAFRSSNNAQRLRINLQTVEKNGVNSTADEVLTSYDQNFSTDIDDLDVVKLGNINESLSIKRNNQKLMVERRSPLKENDTIYLQLDNTVIQNYMFEFNPSGLTSSIASASLEDGYLHTSTPVSLRSVSRYHFSVTKDASSQNSNRFKVILVSKSANPGLPLITKNDFRAYPNPFSGKSFNIDFVDKAKGNYNIQLVNSAGMVVFNRTIMHEGGSSVKTIQVNNKLAKGIYQLKISQGEKESTLRLLSN